MSSQFNLQPGQFLFIQLALEGFATTLRNRYPDESPLNPAEPYEELDKALQAWYDRLPVGTFTINFKERTTHGTENI